MALAAWPDGFPAPEESTYSPSVTDTRLTTNMAVGHDRIRRRTTQKIGEARCKYYISDLEKQQIMDFYDSATNGGVEWFTVPLMTDGAAVLHEARFKAPPTLVKESKIRWGLGVLFTVRRRL